MPVPVVSALEALLRPRSRHQNDVSAWQEHNWRNFASELPGGLELEWQGTAGFRLSHQDTHLLIDPYLSRPPIRQVISRDALLPNHTEISRYVPAASAVLVGHTHFDHAVDVPAIARRHRCRAYGSGSLERLMQLHGLGDQAVRVEAGRVYEIGPFRVTFVESVHSKLTLGLRVPLEGELTCDHLDELHAGRYRCGQVYGIHIEVAGVSFYHQGSADLLDDRIVHRGVDYFLAGIAGRGFTRDYFGRILGRLEPRVIVPNHFDDFFRPLDDDMGFSLNVNFDGFLEEVRRVSPDFAVRALELCQVVGAGSAPRSRAGL